VARGVRDEYADHPGGATGWYVEHGRDYRNPHEDAVAAMVERSLAQFAFTYRTGRVLDLAAGSGEVTRALRAGGIDPSLIDACDPFTASAYEQRTGARCEPFSFADIAQGALDKRRYGAVICSYALHLCEPSWLPTVMLQLATVTDLLVVITPHKRPVINNDWGWELADEYRDAGYRVRLRHYTAAVPPAVG
jgi:hypothetical protein